MIIKKAEFIQSSSSVKNCPKSTKPEFAFLGRSNVGKSSLINYLTGKKNLAKTSVTPGKTRLINHFLLNDEWYLVDLPGYGYARLGKKGRELLLKIIKEYIGKRLQMFGLFMLIDSRHKPQSNDIEFINWLGYNNIPFVIVFTKTDKVSRQELENNVILFRQELKNTWEKLPQLFFTSVKNRTGKEEILEYIDNIIKLNTNKKKN